MKPPISFLLCLTVTVLSIPAVAVAEPSPVHVRTEQSNKLEVEKKYTRNAGRSLKIFVSNGAKDSVDLKVKYFVFGRDVASHDFVTIDQGEKPIQVKGFATEMIETPTAKATAIDAHADKAKRIEAAGIKFVGHAVQVFQADKIVAEFYEPTTVKEQIGKAGPPPTPAKK
jgi:hypothetical protein